ncbi:hypothetical protein KIW84_055388 [Lathyrus oleraceus]|uniref:Uncharacterized protein n=1 Tax=Pisum sativum TaxID=3888 RepID=A0A9D5ALB5_PEA|nr:hypothetical protein KIW84_055388 [Pisum sativum]
MRAKKIDREGTLSGFPLVLPYIPAPADVSVGLGYDSRDRRRHECGHSYSMGYGGSSDLGVGDNYGSYGGSQLAGSSAYEDYESYSLERDSTVW